MFLGLPRGINSIEVKTQPKTLWWIYRPCEHQISSNFLHASTFFKPPVTTTQTIRTTTKNSCTVKNPATFVTVVGFQKNSRLQDQPHRVPPSAMIGCLPILVTLDHRFLHVPWRDNNGCCIHPQSCIHRFNSKSYCISSGFLAKFTENEPFKKLPFNVSDLLFLSSSITDISPSSSSPRCL